MKKYFLFFLILISFCSYSQTATISIWKDSVMGAIWNKATSTVAYNKKRLTFMNKRDDPQLLNKYRLAGFISFMSNHSFLGGVITKSLGLTGYTVKVVFK